MQDLIPLARLTRALKRRLVVSVATLASALISFANAQPPGDQIRVLITGWRNASEPTLSFEIGELVRQRLPSLVSSATWVIPWSDVRNTLEAGTHPDTLSIDDLRMLGRLLRADVVIDVGAIRATDGINLQPVLILPRTDDTPRLLSRIFGRTVHEAANALASLLAREPPIRPPGEE